MTLTCTYVYRGTAHIGLLFSNVYVMSGRWTSSGKQYNALAEPSFYIHFLGSLQSRKRVRHMTLTCIRSSAQKQQRTLDLLLYSVCRCRTLPANALLCPTTFMFIVEITYNFYECFIAHATNVGLDMSLTCTDVLTNSARWPSSQIRLCNARTVDVDMKTV